MQDDFFVNNEPAAVVGYAKIPLLLPNASAVQ
jgi:hypothetical protein